MAEIEATVFDVLCRTLDDIDPDRLAPEMLPAFDLLWRAAGNLISAHRTGIAAARVPLATGSVAAGPEAAAPERFGPRA